jgi:hypothetical protein
MTRVSYSMPAGMRWFTLIGFAGFLAISVALPFLPFQRDDGPPVWFIAVWYFALVWNGYWFLFRLCYRIELDGGVLRWFTPLRHGAIALSDLVSIGSNPLMYQIAAFRPKNGQRIVVQVRNGLKEFVDEVKAQAPEVVVRPAISWSATRIFSITSGFRRED